MTKRNTPRWQPRRGKEHVEALGELYRAPDSTAPQATNTARPAVGETVEVYGLAGRFAVVAADDPSTLTLENENGVLLRVDQRQVRRLGVGQ